MQQFKEALRVQHVKTTAFYPQSTGSIERMHSTLNNLIETSISGRNNKWHEILKFINFAINTMKNQTTSFELMFGQEPDILFTIAA